MCCGRCSKESGYDQMGLDDNLLPDGFQSEDEKFAELDNNYVFGSSEDDEEEFTSYVF